MQIKICGITNKEDATLAVEGGAWALGFIFYHKSPRYIPPQTVKGFINMIPGEVIKVGVFVDKTLDEMLEVQNMLGLDFLQVYKQYDCAARYKKQMILSLKLDSMGAMPAPEVLGEYGYILLDTPWNKSKEYGGTGLTANWEIAKTLSAKYRLILAGGIDCNNIKEARDAVNPYAVDICSGSEAVPGKKDPSKIERIFFNGSAGGG